MTGYPQHPADTGDQAFERTGDDAVDAALERLEQLQQSPGSSGRTALDEHVAVLTDVHERLQRRLMAAEG